jgi:tRNA nucleotidyltransferase (CCA-adding enzyme)
VGGRLAQRLSARLRAPAECGDLARLAARYHATVHRAPELKPATMLDLLLATDALRRPERLEGLLRACAADMMSRPGSSGDYAPRTWLREALEVVRGVDAGRIAAAHPEALDLPQKIRAARIKALREWARAQKKTDGSS